MHSKTHLAILGLPGEENIYHSSESTGEHCQGLLEDGV